MMRAMVPGAPHAPPLTERLPDRADGVQWHVHRDLHVWTWAAAVGAAAALRRRLAEGGRARLLATATGDSSRVLSALARAPLDWARVDVGLVDERWLRPDDPDSQAAHVRRALLVDHAAPARLEPLTLAGRRLEDAVAIANAHARHAPDVVLMAMGEDGEIASLLPDAPDFARAVASTQDYVAFDASFSRTGGAWPRRITATPHGLSRGGLRMLLLRGDAQRRRLEDALRACDPLQSSLAAVYLAGGTPLQVHWCP